MLLLRWLWLFIIIIIFERKKQGNIIFCSNGVLGLNPIPHDPIMVKRKDQIRDLSK
ncbi:MAG TPA: hypothetical protein VEW92_11625 [Nitrososphaeraceae archaeon]|nr:hypothetical protein [Nitrososphaeraceae archaeon]